VRIMLFYGFESGFGRVVFKDVTVSEID